MPSQTAGRRHRRRHTRRRSHRGGAVKFDVMQRSDGKWAITLNGKDMSDKAGPYESEKQARDRLLEVEGFIGLTKLADESAAVAALMKLKEGGRRRHRRSHRA